MTDYWASGSEPSDLGGTRACSAYRVTGNIDGVVRAAILLPFTAESRAIS